MAPSEQLSTVSGEGAIGWGSKVAQNAFIEADSASNKGIFRATLLYCWVGSELDGDVELLGAVELTGAVELDEGSSDNSEIALGANDCDVSPEDVELAGAEG